MAWADIAMLACLFFAGWHVGSVGTSRFRCEPPVIIARHAMLATLGIIASLAVKTVFA